MSRKALRDFYKLEAEKKDVFDPEDFIATAEKSDVISLVKAHRDLVEQRQVLDSEQKALIYNNYKKLIQASEKLEGIDHQSSHSVSELCGTLEDVSNVAVTKRLPLLVGDFEAERAQYEQRYGKLV